MSISGAPFTAEKNAAEEPRAQLSRVEHELFLRSSFPVMPPLEVARQLVHRMRDMRFPRGSELYRQGEPADRIFFVVTGRVMLHAPAEEPWLFEDRSLLGILDASVGRPYVRTARALTEVHALEISIEDYTEVLEEHFEFTMRALTFNSHGLYELALELSPHGVFADERSSEIAFREPNVCETGLNAIERLLVLRHTKVFERAPVQALASLVQHAEERVLDAGQLVHEIDEVVTHIHVLAEGEVELNGGSPEVLATFRPCSSVGAYYPFTARRYSQRATVRTRALLISISLEDFFDVAEDQPGLMRAVFAYTALERERVMQALSLREKSDTQTIE